MNSFISWIGGKHILANTIVGMLPEHSTYVEVFGGAGWVLFRKDPAASRVEVYNDRNEDLVTLFRVLRDNLQGFYERQVFLLASRAEYEAFRRRFRQRAWKDEVERAIGFYYLIKNSFGSGILTGWGFGKTRPTHYRPELEFLERIRDRLRGVYIDCLDFGRLVRNYDSPETAFYCDPPYVVALGQRYYQVDFAEEDHHRLRQVLGSIQGRFILSYDDCPLVRDLWAAFTIEETRKVNYTLNQRGHLGRHRKAELLIRNY